MPKDKRRRSLTKLRESAWVETEVMSDGRTILFPIRVKIELRLTPGSPSVRTRMQRRNPETEAWEEWKTTPWQKNKHARKWAGDLLNQVAFSIGDVVIDHYKEDYPEDYARHLADGEVIAEDCLR